MHFQLRKSVFFLSHGQIFRTPLPLLGQKISLIFTQSPAESNTRHNQVLNTLNHHTVEARNVSTENKKHVVLHSLFR